MTTCGKRGETVLTRNFAAVDQALAALHEVPVPSGRTSDRRRRAALVPDDAGLRATRDARMMAEEERSPSRSAFPPDGTFPTDTARWRSGTSPGRSPSGTPRSHRLVQVRAGLSPRASIRMKVFEPEAIASAPEGFSTRSGRTGSTRDAG